MASSYCYGGCLDQVSDQMRAPCKMQMCVSWNDHLRHEYGKLVTHSALLNLPFELLEPILDEVAFNSVGGLQAFSQASRVCQALARPYYHRQPEVTFDELVPTLLGRSYVTVTLQEISERKTLQLVKPRILAYDIFPNTLRSIQSVLGNQSPYTTVEYLTASDAHRMLSPEALEIINESCPNVSKLVLGLQNIVDFCFEDSSPHFGSSTQCGIREAKLTLAALSHFANLEHLELHFRISELTIQYLHSREGLQVARDLYIHVSRQKQGRRLTRLDLVLSTYCTTLFGHTSLAVKSNRSFVDLQVTMSCSLPPVPSSSFSSSDSNDDNNKKSHNYQHISSPSASCSSSPNPSPASSQSPALILTCSAPAFSQILDLKNTVDQLIGTSTRHIHLRSPHRRQSCRLLTHRFYFSLGWEWEMGPRIWKYIEGDWPDVSERKMQIVRARTVVPVVVWSWWRAVLEGWKIAFLRRGRRRGGAARAGRMK